MNANSTPKPNGKPADTQRSAGCAPMPLFGITLQPYQQRMVDMMLSLPEGAKWRLMVGAGRLRGSYAETKGKLTHRWNGKEWIPLPNDERTHGARK